MIGNLLKRRSLLVALILSLALLAGGLRAQGPKSALENPRIEARVDALLKQMTLEEKVGQLVQRTFGGITGPGRGGGDWPEAAAHGEIGSLFNVTAPEELNTVQRAAVEKSRLHIPVLFGLDVIHGLRTTGRRGC